MSLLEWDQIGERLYETGVDHGVLYVYDSATSSYGEGVAWNGLTAVTESPSGAEANAQYADNIKYLNLYSAEEFGGTIEAFTYPEEFAECNGERSPIQGLTLAQQPRKPFGFSYRTRVGNDTEGVDHGYKIHLVYNAMVSPSERAYATINDSPEAMTLSWEFTTTPVQIGDGATFKPTATLVIDSTKIASAKLKLLEDKLYGTSSTEPELPLPSDVITLLT